MPYFIQRVGAAVTLLILSPVLGIVAAIVRIKDGPPVLFRQTRVGRDRTTFEILKFRTMVHDADKLLVDDPTANRLTTTGHFLRKSSIDELPQLWNVVRGDMAGLGPRAMLPEVAARLPQEFESRFAALPGLTGLAQIRGRNNLPWSQRLAADVEYVRHRSFRGDLKIVVKTFSVLMRGAGFQADRNTEQVDDLGLLKKQDV